MASTFMNAKEKRKKKKQTERARLCCSISANVACLHSQVPQLHTSYYLEVPDAVSDAVPDGHADLPVRPPLLADVLQVELLQLRVLAAAPHSHDAGGAEFEDALQELVQRVVGVAHHQDGSAAHLGVRPHLPVLQQDLGHLETHVRFARAWRALDDGQLFGQRRADCFQLKVITGLAQTSVCIKKIKYVLHVICTKS